MMINKVYEFNKLIPIGQQMTYRQLSYVSNMLLFKEFFFFYITSCINVSKVHQDNLKYQSKLNVR